ncbi:Hemicentin-2, partial [Armadillidium nasatum]
EFTQTDKSSLYVSSKRTFAVNGYHHPYTWTETVDYDRSLGTMPFLRQTLHANSVSASYRCLSGVEGSNAKGELALMVSSVIMPSSENSTCPDGFTYTDKEDSMALCLDNDECLLRRVEVFSLLQECHVDECAEEEPACEQRCQNLIGSYRCECFRGFNIDATLGHCIDVDECSTFQHNCTDDQKCRNYDGGFSCVVNCPVGLRLTANGSCIDINECAELTAGCHYTQRCENMWGRYRCSCQKGFKSMGPGHPCLDINECHTSPPPCNYECRNLIGDYECICPPGFRRLRDRKTCIASYQYAEHPRTGQAYYPQPQLRRRPSLPGFSSKEYQHRLLRRVYKVKNCPKGLIQDGDQCKGI